MELEVGKCYRHSSGKEISIVGVLNTTMYVWGGIAEQSDRSDFTGVQLNDEDAGVGWEEITEEEWMKNFTD